MSLTCGLQSVYAKTPDKRYSIDIKRIYKYGMIFADIGCES